MIPQEFPEVPINPELLIEKERLENWYAEKMEMLEKAGDKKMIKQLQDQKIKINDQWNIIKNFKKDLPAKNEDEKNEIPANTDDEKNNVKHKLKESDTIDFLKQLLKIKVVQSDKRSACLENILSMQMKLVNAYPHIKTRLLKLLNDEESEPDFWQTLNWSVVRCLNEEVEPKIEDL